jgi:hypothetical protein
MPKILMLTTDQAIDRRILLEADALAADGWEVTILAMPGSGSGEFAFPQSWPDLPATKGVRGPHRFRADERRAYKFFDAAAVAAASPHSGAAAPSPQRLGR